MYNSFGLVKSENSIPSQSSIKAPWSYQFTLFNFFLHCSNIQNSKLRRLSTKNGNFHKFKNKWSGSMWLCPFLSQC
jgi:hypothetical protein